MPRAVVQTTATTTAQSTHIMAAASTRTLTTTPAAQRKATEVVKESLKTVDRAVSNKIVDGINIGCKCSAPLAVH